MRARGSARSARRGSTRSEEHTSELQSRQYLVCRLLLERMHRTPISTLFPYTTLFRSRGPSTRATLNWMELSATAFGRSFLSTSDGMSELYAGPPNDCAQPVTNESARICQICTARKYISSASAPDVLI